MGISTLDYQMMQARLERQAGKRPDLKKIDDAVDYETDLQHQINDFLNERQWYFVWSPMHMRTSTKKGTPDYVISAPNGRTIWIECKSKTGKSSIEQLGAARMIKAQGGEHHVVRSYRQFCEVIANPP